MSKKHAALLMALLLGACVKENTGTRLQSSNESLAKAYTPPNQKIPLVDLGTGTFGDSMGGLYPDGSNTPSGTYADDLYLISQTIVPTDTFGNPSRSAKAKIVFL